MKSLLLILSILISSQALATSGRAFGLLNTSMSFVDNGKLDAGDDVRYEADMEGYGYGVGAEYKLQTNSSGISFHPGFIYEFQRNVEQVTGVTSGAANSSQDSVPKIQMTTIYGNTYFPVTEQISIVGGASYLIPKVDSSGSFKGYKIEQGVGFQFGVDFKLQDNFFVQMLHREIVLDTKDDAYKGKADLSNLSLLVGKEF